MDDSKYLSERLLVRTNFRVCFNGNPQIYIRVTTKEINTKGFVKTNDYRRKSRQTCPFAVVINNVAIKKI